MDFIVRWKYSHSKITSFQDVTNHLSIDSDESLKILCGIDKRFPDLYEAGFEPIENIEASKLNICKKCYQSYLILTESQI